MILLFLPLLITGALGEQLIESWECGSKTVWLSQNVAQASIGHCHYAVKDAANLCCKAHDVCYEVHSLNAKFTKDYCDSRFHVCLHDAGEKNKIYDCNAPLGLFHPFAKFGGNSAYNKAKPTDRKDEFAGFVDLHPLKLDMQSLLKACPYSKMLVVHCHNSVHKCLQNDHERIRRLSAEEYTEVLPYQDCRSTMKDCINRVIEYAPTENCGAMAKSIYDSLNVYIQLDAEKYGTEIIDAYPIHGPRLIKLCLNSEPALRACFLSFDSCAQNNRREHPKLYNAVWKSKILCHQQLRACVRTATSEETNEFCLEASSLAISRMREVDVPPQKTVPKAMLDAGIDMTARGMNAVANGAKKVGRAVVKVTTKVVDVVSDAGKAVGRKAKQAWKKWFG